MIGIEISLNDQKPIIAAAENLVFVDLLYGYSYDQISVRGSDDLRMFTWFKGESQKGDKVLIRIVETDRVSPVIAMKDCDRTEMKKWYEYYKSKLQKKGLI